MKKCINAWAIDPETDFRGVFEILKAHGYSAVELNLDKDGSSRHSLTEGMGKGELAEIRRMAGDFGIPVISISTSLYQGNLMGSPDPCDRQKAADVLKLQLELATELGAGGILAVPGGATLQGSYVRAYEACFGVLSGLKADIESSGINVGLENVWNGFFLSPFDMASLIDRLASPHIGAYFDVGNVVAFSWPQYWIEALGSRINHIHIKDFKRNRNINSGGSFTGLTQGDVDWLAVISALKSAGFDGYLTAEVFKADYAGADLAYDDFYRISSEAADSIIAISNNQQEA